MPVSLCLFFDAHFPRFQLFTLFFSLLSVFFLFFLLTQSRFLRFFHSLAHTHTDVVGILDDTRLRHAKSVVRARFGVEAARVFHILLERKLLEEKQVCARQLYTHTHIHAQNTINSFSY
jgi:hypothetical protein